MASSLRQKDAPTGADFSTGGQDTLGTSTVPWKDVQTVNMTAKGNVVVEGNLTVTGNATEVTVDKLSVEESMIKLAKVNTGAGTSSADIGLYGVEDTSGTPKYHGFVRDADDATWKLFEGNQDAPADTAVNFSGTGNSDGTLQAKVNLPAAGDLKIAGTVVGATADELNVLDGATAGTAVASKALIVDSNKDIDGVRNITATGIVQAGDILIQGSAITVDGGGSPTLNTVDIDGGTIDNTTIGAENPSSIVSTTLVAKGNVDLGDADTDTLTITAKVDSDIIPTGTVDLGATGSKWAEAHIVAANVETLQSSGNVDLGTNSTNTLTLNASLDSDILPETDSTHSIGSTSKRWLHLYSDNITASTLNGALSGNASTASALQNARTIQISGDSAGSASFDGSANINITTTIQTDAVENSMISNPGFNYSDGGTSELIELGSTITIQGTSNELEVSRSSGTFTLGLPSTVSGLTSVSSTGFTGDLTGNSDTATALETARNIGITSGPVQASNVSFDGTGNVALTTTIANDQITNAMLANDKLVIQIDSVDYDQTLGSTIEFAKGGDLTLDFSSVDNRITYSLPSNLTADTSGNAATATAQETSRTFSITGSEVQASAVSYNGTANVELSASIQAGSVANSKLANSSFSITDGANSTDISLGGELKIVGTSNEVEVAESNGTVTLGLPSSITATLNGNASTATALATGRNIGITSGPVRAANVSFDGTGAVALTSTIADSEITNAMLAGSIADSKLNQLTTAGKVALSSLEIDGETNSLDALADADLFIVDDGAAGSNKKAQATLLRDYARSKFSVTDSGGDGSLTYNSSEGVFTYTGPSASDVRAHISAGTGVTISSGEIAIGQAVATDSNVTFAQVTIGTNAVISETDAEKIDDITDGTAAANKALVVDSNKDIASIRNLSATQLSDGTATLTAGALTDLTDLRVDNLQLNGNDLKSTSGDLNLNSASGSVKIAAGDNLVLQSSGDITADGDVLINGLLETDGVRRKIEVKTDSYQITGDDHIVFFNVSSDKTCTLPSSDDSDMVSKEYVIKNVGSNTITFSSSSQINGSAASSTTLTAGQKITVIGTGSFGWQEI